MNEFEVWSVLTSFMISNAIYTAAVFFMVWVAFRAANQVAAENANTLTKILVSLFALGIIFNGLTVSGNLMLNLESTALSLQMVGTENPNALRFIASYGGGGEPAFSFISNPINAAWWAVVTVMILGKVWLKNGDS
jgi:hypothetical protein